MREQVRRGEQGSLAVYTAVVMLLLAVVVHARRACDLRNQSPCGGGVARRDSTQTRNRIQSPCVEEAYR